MYHIFIEGIPGSGKSTLLNKLQTRLPAYNFYYEGDISPIELAWCSYMNQEQYEKACFDWSDLVEAIKANTKREDNHYIVSYTRIQTENNEFYQYMENYEIYGGRKDIKEFSKIVLDRFKKYNGSNNIFECSFFQNIIEELMLFGEYEEEEIIAFYRKLIANLNLEQMLIIRLVSPDIRESIMQIKKERVNEKKEEFWYHLMLEYLKKSPYGKAHNYKGFEDILVHFNRRVKIENRIATEVLHNKCIDMESKNYQLEDILGLLER